MTVPENICIFTNCDNMSQMCNEECVDTISLPLGMYTSITLI